MPRLSVPLLCAAAAGFAVERPSEVVRRMNALDETDFIAVRLLAFEAGQLDTLTLMMKHADAAALLRMTLRVTSPRSASG